MLFYVKYMQSLKTPLETFESYKKLLELQVSRNKMSATLIGSQYNIPNLFKDCLTSVTYWMKLYLDVTKAMAKIIIDLWQGCRSNVTEVLHNCHKLSDNQHFFGIYLRLLQEPVIPCKL